MLRWLCSSERRIIDEQMLNPMGRSFFRWDSVDLPFVTINQFFLKSRKKKKSGALQRKLLRFISCDKRTKSLNIMTTILMKWKLSNLCPHLMHGLSKLKIFIYSTLTLNENMIVLKTEVIDFKKISAISKCYGVKKGC